MPSFPGEARVHQEMSVPPSRVHAENCLNLGFPTPTQGSNVREYKSYRLRVDEHKLSLIVNDLHRHQYDSLGIQP